MFERLVDQWNNGGAERFVHDALSHSFRRLDVRSKLVIQSNLKTPAAVRQVALSRSALEKCIVELLLRGKLSDLHGRGWRMDEPCAIKSQELKSDVSRWLEEHDPRTARHGGTLHTIISTIEKYIGSSTTVARPKGRDPNTGGRIQLPTVRILPPREDALQHALANGLITEEEHRAAHEAAELEEKENDLELENIKVSSRSARLRSRVTGLH